ncbi:sulfite exporter TauE/SafE family protein [Loigolactobacillus jiayinensis]|uniref:Probable membrane transporter protein n=1 Tax=Loigolactobacillus jiayinensis TaxID=2486016 RepID=A0ABW1RFR3_9LACO|nr:sulfite exporter TauE/SafE family protein [Loigolactobacillus jiayinensis]
MPLLGIIYFLVIIVANSLGAISGMGGGVLIKPIFDLIGVDSVAAISFYSAVAVFVMSITATIKQRQNGVKLKGSFISWLAVGAIIGGIAGKNLLTVLLRVTVEKNVLSVQISITIITILFAFFSTRYGWRSWQLTGWYWSLGCGLLLGGFASFLGIGGGPINVALLMLMFGLPIKEATLYSLCTIFFSQGSKLVSLIVSDELSLINLELLWFIIPAALLGGYVGSLFSKILSDDKVTLVFQGMLLVVILINTYNGIRLFI